jgi:hypothetical protein
MYAAARQTFAAAADGDLLPALALGRVSNHAPPCQDRPTHSQDHPGGELAPPARTNLWYRPPTHIAGGYAQGQPRGRRRRGAALIVSWLDGEAETKDSDYLVSSRARELMERVTPSLEAAGLDVRSRQPVHGVAYLSTFADNMDSILTKLGIEQ